MTTAIVDVKPAAEPSAAAPERVEFNDWDAEGTPIVKKSEPQLKSQEPAPADAPKVEKPEPKGESAAEPGAAPKQEQKPAGHKLSADERIKQLLADKKRLETELETERGRPRAAEPKPAPQPAKDAKPATFEDWRKDFKPKAWVEKYIDEHKCDYEDGVAAMTDHMSVVRDQYRQEAEQRRQSSEAINRQFADAQKAYPDFKEKAGPILDTLKSDASIPEFFKAAVGNSPVFSHLIYALSTEQAKTLLDTAKTNPVQALKQLGVLEDAVMKELNKGKKEDEPPKKAEAPAEPPKPRAPKPPSEVGGRSITEEDPSVAAARSGDFSTFEKSENAKRQQRFARRA